MDKIIKYITDIGVYVILSGFISVILPNNSFRKYTGLVMGIILVRIIIEPLKRGFIW